MIHVATLFSIAISFLKFFFSHMFYLFPKFYLVISLSYLFFFFFSKFGPTIFLSTYLFSQKLKNKIFKKNAILIKKNV
jgi:hypothetical protein